MVKDCLHEHYTKERMRGQETGDYICTCCRYVGSLKELKEAHAILNGRHLHISRHKQPEKGSYGYYVRCKGNSKWFAYKKNGGRARALLMALAYRDGLMGS